MKLHAFVAMPFGVKNDSQGRRIDFTRVYQELIKPGLEMALPDISPDNDAEHDTCCGVNIADVVFNPLYSEKSSLATSEAEADDQRDEALFDTRFSALKIEPGRDQPVVLGVPPWGERLREKLRESVHQSTSQSHH